MKRSTYIVVILLAAILSNGCQSKEEEKHGGPDAQQPAAPPATEVFHLQKGRLSSALHIPGELIAYQEVDLYAKENSFVKKLYADVGTEVKTGQLLVTLEAPELSTQLAGALSNMRSREAIYIASKSNYDRLLATSQTPGTISPNDLEQADARKNSDQALWQAARDAYQQIVVTQGYLQIKAPFDGIITARNVNPGAYVGPSGKGSELPLFTLKEQKRLRLVISVPESYTSYLVAKNEVSFTVRALPDQQFKAHINRLSGAIDDKLHSQRIEMDVMNNNRKLLPGMVAEVNLPLPSSDSTFIVPKSAVVNSSESVFVIRVTNKKAEWVKVKTGRQEQNMMEIYGKLNPDDMLVMVATEEVREGSDVVTKEKSTGEKGQ